ncbi:hypothetical protein GT037_002938 [Alternaria burnsii]|uniref:Uncharacterized protein n=1 Tax=Alternaria burnsii TaxID=1187904 RepID=A0A8H7BD80_9PLEO|nr:uncharacterized protein GT037_002938 [Alternaria burnsii]KAF7679190.1 hypothetical protein GT037_002938 [Alternaria burnsii]
MANIQIKCLPELACEIPPSSLYSELPIQERLVTVGMNTSGLSVNGPAVVPNSTEATKICRVLAAYHGVVPQSKHTVVVGMHADKNNQDKAAAVFRTARETVQTERYGPNSFIQQFVPGKNMSPIVVGIHPNPVDQTRATSMFRTARETVQTEKYGPKSFIQQYIPGKVCTEDFLVQQTNFSIEARARELQPPNETQAETNTRTADRQAFLDAIASGERLWKTTYESEYRRTVDALPAAKGLESERLARKAEFFKTMKDNPPRCAIDLATLHTRQGCNQAKMIPLGLRNWEQCLDFWQATITDDILTSYLEKASNVVDIRKMLVRGNVPDFKDIQGNL